MGAALLHTEPAGERYTPIGDEVLQQTGADHFALSKDVVTPLYRGSQEEKVVLTQGGSRETTADSASRIEELEE